MRTPTQEAVEDSLRGLVEATYTREDVTDWATRWYLDDSVRIADPKIRQALYHLTGADTPTTNRPYLYR